MDSPAGSRDTRTDVPAISLTQNGPQRTDLNIPVPIDSQDNHFEMSDSRQSPLPEDDGMGVLRKKIHTIRDRELPSAEKARMVHELMTESYHSSKGRSTGQQRRYTIRLSDLHTCGSELVGDQPSTTPTSIISAMQTGGPWNLTLEALKPTFAPKEEPDSALAEPEDGGDAEELEEVSLGCQHYKRNVKLQCSTCKKWYTCRFCHDAVEDHHLIRPKTEYMLCMICGCAQPAGQWCKHCGEQTAQYYCNVCKLWDNDSKKSIYHCSDCGICRIGQGLGKDFFHCKVEKTPSPPRKDYTGVQQLTNRLDL